MICEHYYLIFTQNIDSLIKGPSINDVTAVGGKNINDFETTTLKPDH
jgi:hypothetical protein